jgi:hypothetical protein
VLAVVLADVAARGAVRQLDAKLHPARHHADLSGLHVENPELGVHCQATELRHDHHLAVRVVEEAVAHRCVGREHVHGRARVLQRIAVPAQATMPSTKSWGVGTGIGFHRS